ncbi:MAG: tetratricopeptide repeat protein [Chloroflexi bacterium]|nr:tetratricopeptide repeat protein [Chloroflexota bacterium]
MSVKGLVLAFNVKYEEALKASDDAVKAGSDSDYYWLDRGSILLLKDELDTAKRCLEKVLDNNSDDWFWISRVGLIYLQANLAAPAIGLLTEACSIKGDCPYLWYRLGTAQTMAKNQGKAKFYFQKALEADPKYRPALNALNKTRRKECFIATHVFGEDSKEVAILREYRYSFLETNWAGRLFVKIYYLAGPGMAELMKRFPVLEKSGRQILLTVVEFLKRRV